MNCELSEPDVQLIPPIVKEVKPFVKLVVDVDINFNSQILSVIQDL